jgi:GNAT superfamily N-acetyltransferase
MAAQAVEELRPTRGGDLWAATVHRRSPLIEAFTAEMAQSDRLVVVGTVDEALAGYGVVREEMLNDGRPLGVVEDLYTEPTARGVGVGEAMMNLLVAWCRERHCIGIDAVALPGNRATKNFFETFGLTARAIVVHRSLEQDQGKEGEAP